MFTYEALQKLFSTLGIVSILMFATAIYGVWVYMKRRDSKREQANQDLIQQIRELTTGGNGFSYVTIYPGHDDEVPVILRNRSGIPIYGLHITIIWQPFDEVSGSLADVNTQPMVSHPQDSVQFRPIPEIPRYFHGMTIGKIQGRVNGTYTIVFDARNGSWIQEYSIWKSPGQPEKHFWKVTKYIAGKEQVLREETTEIQPRKAFLSAV